MLIGLFALLWSLLLLTTFVHFFPASLLDIAVSREVQEQVTLLPVMRVISVFGTPLVGGLMVIGIAALFAVFSYRREALFTLLTLIAVGCNVPLKLAVNRPRPSESVVQVFEKHSTPSFPSGHVVFYTIFFGFLAIAIWHVRNLADPLKATISTVCLLLVILVSLSRVFLGAHWVTDVIGGYIFGSLLLGVLLTFYFSRRRR